MLKYLLLLCVLGCGAEATIPDIEQYPPIPITNFEVKDINGKLINLESFEGNVVLVHFWATWCANCTKEMKSLDRLQKLVRKEPIIVMPISEDFKGLEVVKEFYKNHKLKSLLSFIDNKNELFSMLGAVNLPTSYIISTDGKNVSKITGAVDWESDQMVQLLRSYIQPRESVNSDYMNLLKQQTHEEETVVEKPETIPAEAITEISPVELEAAEAGEKTQEKHFTNIQKDNFSLKVKRPVNTEEGNTSEEIAQ